MARLHTQHQSIRIYVYPDEFEEEYIDKDEDLDPWQIATNALIEWFSKCWIAAGGKSFKLNACQYRPP
ncbi:hypothetical protein NUITMVS1_09790 [Shewanella xiamenensis]|nr:hypothetical protein NUITMVS1_09790 [Shewanella xiamenensis]